MSFFNTVFGKIDLFDTKCEYISVCAMYKKDSYVCTEEVDKSYCGIYKQFLQNNLKYCTQMSE